MSEPYEIGETYEQPIIDPSGRPVLITQEGMLFTIEVLKGHYETVLKQVLAAGFVCAVRVYEMGEDGAWHRIRSDMPGEEE